MCKIKEHAKQSLKLPTIPKIRYKLKVPFKYDLARERYSAIEKKQKLYFGNSNPCPDRHDTITTVLFMVQTIPAQIRMGLRSPVQ